MSASIGDSIDPVYRARKEGETADDYVLCAICKGPFPKATISKHLNSCLETDKIEGRVSKKLHNLVISDVHPDADDRLKIIMSSFNGDYISQIAKTDEVIVHFANWVAYKFRSDKNHGQQIRANMRMAARILLASKELDPTISAFKDLLCDSKIPILLKVADIISGFKDDILPTLLQ